MEVCRLCLDLQSDNNYLPLAGNYKDMVQVVAPELNLEISNAPVVCNECSSNLDELFVFKTKCFENEQKIRPKCENNKNKFRLKQVLDGTTDVEETALKPDKTKDRVCRTCMEPIESESFTILKPSEPDAYLDSMLTMCLNDIDLELTKDPVICESCMDNLQKLHHFKSTSLDVEDKLTNFCETHGTNSSEQINLNSVLEYEISKTDADSGFVNVKVENYEDESEDASMKSEMGSEMTVDSELKQEEIDIKSEAGTSSDKLMAHQLIKNGTASERTKKRCTKCLYKTYKLFDLRRHEKAVHQKPQNYQCSDCDFKTSWAQNLKKHETTAHGKNKIYACVECSYKTHQNVLLLQHLLSEHGIGDESHLKKCTECPYATQKLHQLRKHLITAHKKIQLFECSKCNFKTCWVRNLKCHEDHFHTDFKYKCNKCFYAAKREEQLTDHLLNRHRIGDHSKLKKCMKCPYVSVHAKNLSRHEKTVHKDV